MGVVVYGGRAAEIEFRGAPILDGGKSFPPGVGRA